MKILYLSTLVSPMALREAEEKDSSFSAYAVQKFNGLIAQGLVNNGVEVISLSTFYQPKVGLGYKRKAENYNGILFKYIPTLNLSVLRHLWLIVFCFVKVILFGCTQRKNKALVCDVLNISACLGAVFAAKLIGLRRVGLLTDMPEFFANNSTRRKVKERISFGVRLNRYVINGFTHYVFLTEQMNEVLNLKSKPYVIIEGLVDSAFEPSKKNEVESKRIVVYAGGLNERYGLRILIEGFIQANVVECELNIYGDGPFVSEIRKYEKTYRNIIYKGIRPNEIIVEKELEATLLVNPRPTTEDFTKYSFPSKNMEYMLSGTPVLTTKLPGMPPEYYPYVYLFDEESVSGYAKRIHEILSLSKEELCLKGQKAQQWVMQRKNNNVQSKKIIDLLKQ